MKENNLKELLIDAWKLEGELIRIIKNWIRVHYPDYAQILIRRFEEDLKDGMDMCGCLQDIFNHLTNHLKDLKLDAENEIIEQYDTSIST